MHYKMNIFGACAPYSRFRFFINLVHVKNIPMATVVTLNDNVSNGKLHCHDFRSYKSGWPAG